MGPGPPDATSTLTQAPSLHPSTYPLTSHPTPPPRRKEKPKKRLNVCTNPIHTNVQKKCCTIPHPQKCRHAFELCNPKRKKERKKKHKNPKKKAPTSYKKVSFLRIRLRPIDLFVKSLCLHPLLLPPQSLIREVSGK